MAKQRKPSQPSDEPSQSGRDHGLRKRDAKGKVSSNVKGHKASPPTVSNRKVTAAKDGKKKNQVKDELIQSNPRTKPQPPPKQDEHELDDDDVDVEEDEQMSNSIPEKVRKMNSGIRHPIFKGLPSKSSPPPASASSSSTSVNPYCATDRIPKSKFEDIAGMDDIIKYIKNKVVLPFMYPTNAKLMKRQIPRGVLFTGKPGTGKTSLADAIVNEVRKKRPDCVYLEECGQCLSKWVGETEGGIRRLFQTAAERSPAIIFFDEIDGLAKKRETGCSSFGTSLITTLLTEINNVEPGKVLVIAATNTQGLLDPALVRKGRMDIKIHIPLPDARAQKSILSHYIAKKEMRMSQNVVEQMVEELKPFNLAPCDLEWLVEDIHDNILEKLFPNNEWSEMQPSALGKRLEILKNKDLLEEDVNPSMRRLKEERKVDEGESLPVDNQEEEEEE